MPTVARRIEIARHEVKRVAQTGRTFSNWPALLRELAGAQVGRGADELTFRTRTGPTLTCPNVPGARLAVYEQYADDSYRLGWLLGPLAGQPLQVIDVGAHVGAFTTNIASLNPGTAVECYEPSEQSARYLRRNLEQNGMAGRCVVHQLALADKAGEALFDDNSGGSVHNGLVRDEQRLVDGDDAAGHRATVRVETSTFDAAVAAAPRPPDVVKMDCEGGEYGLVYASSPDSWASVQRIVLEYHPVDGESWEELLGWFERIGLRTIRREPGGPALGTAWLSRV